MEFSVTESVRTWQFIFSTPLNMVNLLFCGCLDVQLYCNTWESSHTGRSLTDEKIWTVFISHWWTLLQKACVWLWKPKKSLDSKMADEVRLKNQTLQYPSCTRFVFKEMYPVSCSIVLSILLLCHFNPVDNSFLKVKNKWRLVLNKRFDSCHQDVVTKILESIRELPET